MSNTAVIAPLSKADLRARKPSRAAFLQGARRPLIVVLDSLKCAHNIGTILRIADATLVERVFICGDTIVPPNGKIKAGSRGAERWVPWEYRDRASNVVAELKQKGAHIYCAEIAERSIPYDEVTYRLPACLVLGREYDGVSSEVLSQADAVVSIPILGMANSLNVSVTAGIILYELCRQLKASTCPHSSTPSVGGEQVYGGFGPDKSE